MSERQEGAPIPAPDDSLTIALSLAKQGWPVFPVRLIPVIRADGTKAVDKRPLIQWLEGATTDLEQIATWWSLGVDFPRGGNAPAVELWVGVHAARAGIVVVDLDVDKKTGESFGLVNAKAAGLDLPKTLRYRTRSGGRHLVYRAPKDRTLTIGQGGVTPGLPPGVDIRAGHGLFVYYGPALTEKPTLAQAPDWALLDGSVSARGAEGDVAVWLRRAARGKPEGQLKKVLRKTDFADLKHDPMLEVVSDIIKRGGERGAATVYAAARDRYIEGRPDRARDWDNAAAGSIGKHGLPPLTIALTKPQKLAIRERNRPKAVAERKEKKRREYRIAIHSARSDQAGKRVLEDGPLAVELADAMRDHWAWTKGRGLMRWTGKVWAEAEPHHLVEEVRQRLDRVEIEEHEVGVTRGDNKAVDKARTLLSRNRARAVSDLVIGRLALDEGDFDAHPDLLNVQNGVVDLRTSKLMPHDSTLRLTKIAGVEYDAKAKTKRWDQALEALPAKVAAWWKVRVGQAATGYTPDDDMLTLLEGAGENGKTTILLAIRQALGGYAVTVPDRLLAADPGDHPTTLMLLMGARLAVFEELPEGRNLNIKRLKDAVGTPYITARRMRQDDVTFPTTHALVGATNYLPIVAETDHGTWRRLALIRFPYRFVKSKSLVTSDRDRIGDPRLKRHFEKPDAAVLRWIVEGARAWYDNGERMPEPPRRVVRDTESWRLDADPVLGYIEERLTLDPGFAVTTDDLARDFNDHLERRGHRPWSAQTINARFEGHVGMAGVERKQVMFGRIQPSRPPLVIRPIPASTKAWVGIRFKAEADPVVPMSDEVRDLDRRMRG